MNKFQVKIIPYQLLFKRPAGTSRGVYHTHDVWYVVIQSNEDAEHWGIGECAPLPDLSCDKYGKWSSSDLPSGNPKDMHQPYVQTLDHFCKKLEIEGQVDREALRPYPSILFGLETALKHYEQRKFELWETPFSEGKEGILINGLIWMGKYDYMLEQIEAKMQQGFRCVKLKIGAINFEDELKLIQHIRSHFSAKEIELRVDANGAFATKDALEKLKRLSDLDLHSIEQPIRAGQWDEMARLTELTPLPIALDEELIGVNEPDDKKRLLETIKPQYIILKPTLHGGISGSTEWISLAEIRGIDWWITSALESNIGLNAVAQWCATFNNPLPQGLGTGGLYTNNIDMPLETRGDCLWYTPSDIPLRYGNIIKG